MMVKLHLRASHVPSASFAVCHF